MEIGHKKQLAHDELGHSKLKYHLDLTRPPGQNHLKVDELGAGNFVLVNNGSPGSNPAHSLTADGLMLSIERPAGASGSMGHWAAVPVQAVALPDEFLLVATFERPTRVSLNANPAVGVYAPSLLMNIGGGALMGATCQFRPEGIRLNFPGTGIAANRPPITQELADRIQHATHPSPFTLALTVKRGETGNTGNGFFFVGHDLADSFAFTFSNLPDPGGILDVRAGIGTANGVEYRASVVLLDVQIWGPKR